MQVSIIFLDIDGVLHTHRYERILARKGEPRYDRDGPAFDPKCVEVLKWLVKKTHAKIVITSSWRGCTDEAHALEVMRRIWGNRKMPGDILGITPNLTAEQIKSLSGKENTRRWKDYEVAEWLTRHPECASYVIIDDNRLFLHNQRKHFVKTCSKKGLTRITAWRASRILLRQFTR